jgi:UPF0176 protein
MQNTVLLYYKFVEISNPQEVADWQRALCQRLSLKGRILVGVEGINGTVAGEREAIEEYKKEVWANSYFFDLIFKESQADGNPFPKLKVKVRAEIISIHHEKVTVAERAPYISPDQLEKLFASDEEFYIVDTRNNYESIEGTFEGAITPNIEHFRHLSKEVDSLKSLKNKKIVTCCTGGIRCEKASALLRQEGFSEVYQLEGGIVSYIMKYPNSHYKGDMYVFDDRMRLTQQEIATNGVISRAPQSQLPQS